MFRHELKKYSIDLLILFSNGQKASNNNNNNNDDDNKNDKGFLRPVLIFSPRRHETYPNL
jgi:hypothetical protein